MVQQVHQTLNQLIQTHQVMPTASSREALFVGLFELKQWHIILLGDAEERLPYIEYEEGEPVLLVFTDAERATSAARVWIEDRTETRVKVESLSVESLLSVLRDFHLGGIEFLRFDHGPCSVRVPIADAIAAARVHDVMSYEGIDDLVDAAVHGAESVIGKISGMRYASCRVGISWPMSPKVMTHLSGSCMMSHACLCSPIQIVPAPMQSSTVLKGARPMLVA